MTAFFSFFNCLIRSKVVMIRSFLYVRNSRPGRFMTYYCIKRYTCQVNWQDRQKTSLRLGRICWKDLYIVRLWAIIISNWIEILQGSGASPNRRYSPRPVPVTVRLIWCNSKTDSKVWMRWRSVQQQLLDGFQGPGFYRGLFYTDLSTLCTAV